MKLWHKLAILNPAIVKDVQLLSSEWLIWLVYREALTNSPGLE